MLQYEQPNHANARANRVVHRENDLHSLPFFRLCLHKQWWLSYKHNYTFQP